jgi:hypothetical protein
MLKVLRINKRSLVALIWVYNDPQNIGAFFTFQFFSQYNDFNAP